MGNPKGFITIKREKGVCRPVCERTKDFLEVTPVRNDAVIKEQAGRCMDCGTPFCHWGCPLGNYIPEWNDLAYAGRWAEAFELLNATNNLPEVTGRVCPALCEYACVLSINDEPITIRENELGIIEHAFKHRLVKPRPPLKRTGKKVAVIGSGPAGLACAAQLNQAGHTVTVFEKDEKPGGIMRFGIPDFKLDKKVLDRRLAIWKKEGIIFKTGVKAGADFPVKKYDAVCLAGGSRFPRDLKLPGRELKGIYFAMDYLTQSNRRLGTIDAKGKKVVVIGGGDTGSDCVGTANRQGAACVVQIEIMPKPGEVRPANQPWPVYPMLLKTSTSHEEGCERSWEVATKKFVGKNGQLNKLVCERPEGEFEIEADLVFLALGFLSPEHEGLLDGLKVEYDQRGNVKTGDDYQTSVKGVFAAGDMRRGQSLIVWAIAEGRQAAVQIDRFLTIILIPGKGRSFQSSENNLGSPAP